MKRKAVVTSDSDGPPRKRAHLARQISLVDDVWLLIMARIPRCKQGIHTLVNLSLVSTRIYWLSLHSQFWSDLDALKRPAISDRQVNRLMQTIIDTFEALMTDAAEKSFARMLQSGTAPEQIDRIRQRVDELVAGARVSTGFSAPLLFRIPSKIWRRFSRRDRAWLLRAFIGQLHVLDSNFHIWLGEQFTLSTSSCDAAYVWPVTIEWRNATDAEPVDHSMLYANRAAFYVSKLRQLRRKVPITVLAESPKPNATLSTLVRAVPDTAPGAWTVTAYRLEPALEDQPVDGQYRWNPEFQFNKGELYAVRMQRMPRSREGRTNAMNEGYRNAIKLDYLIECAEQGLPAIDV